jgi:protein gp37
VLTKRPERALRYADRLPWPDNIWMGTSVESLDVARRVDALRQIPAKVRFLSAEPLLGPLNGLDLTGIHWVIGGGESLTGIHWVIGGGESGVGARVCAPEWARGLRDLCQRGGVAFFWKQWGGRTSKSGGRVLDGREWSEYPVKLETTLAPG